jgi:hypothetical protein
MAHGPMESSIIAPKQSGPSTKKQNGGSKHYAYPFSEDFLTAERVGYTPSTFVCTFVFARVSQSV